MANVTLNSSVILNEALTILHNKNNFLNNINHQYDRSFGEYGSAGKPGTQLQIRLPNRYTSRSGLTVSVQSTVENTVTLTRGSVIGIDLDFNDIELESNINDFSKNWLQPAISQLSTDLENEIFTAAYKSVYNVAGTPGFIPGRAPATYSASLAYSNAKLLMNRGLAPKDGSWCMIVPSSMESGAINEFRGQFQAASMIKKQYLEGEMGRYMYFDWYTNELAPPHTNGLQAGTPLVNGAGQAGSSLLTKGWAAGTTITQGTVFVISSGTAVNMVHPETRITYGTSDLTATVAGGTAVGQQFVVTADATADASGLATLSISPSIVTSGAYKTVTASPDNNAGITIQTGSASLTYPQALAFHPDFYTFVTADLELPKNMEMAERRSMDGISMRFLRGYDIINARRISRLDILYGHASLRPGFAARIIGG